MKKRDNTKKDKKTTIRMTSAFLFLAALMLVSFIVLFNVSKENGMSIGHLNAEQVAQDIKYYLVWESDEIALTAKSMQTTSNWLMITMAMTLATR